MGDVRPREREPDFFILFFGDTSVRRNSGVVPERHQPRVEKRVPSRFFKLSHRLGTEVSVLVTSLLSALVCAEENMLSSRCCLLGCHDFVSDGRHCSSCSSSKWRASGRTTVHLGSVERTTLHDVMTFYTLLNQRWQ